jgi:hypothetical protein
MSCKIYILKPSFLFKGKLLNRITRREIKKIMIIELSFAIVGGANLGLEKSWKAVEQLMKRYPQATWKKKVDLKKGKGKYIIEIN